MNPPASRIERWAFALLMLFAIGAMFALGFENLAQARPERGLSLIAIGLLSIITTIWLLLAGDHV